MMRKLPDCPRCELDELWLWKHAKWVEVRCYFCGMTLMIAPRPAEDELDDAVAEVVAKAITGTIAT